MRLIIGCEESQIVCKAFRELGHEAYSCDLQPCSCGHPEWHFQEDIFKVLGGGNYDMAIIHPPCTYLTVTANKWLKDQPERKSGKLVGEARRQAKKEAEEFFMKLWNYPIGKLCLENPVGSINSILKPTQIIQPYMFGDEAMKNTCLWLRGLPPLFHAKEVDLFNSNVTHVGKGDRMIYKSGKSLPAWYSKGRGEERQKNRSKTFPGIAKAMAEQWGSLK
jgi:hypothetical protein